MKDLQYLHHHGYFKIFTFMVLAITIASSSSWVVVESATNVTEDDVRCLKGVKKSLRDPEGKLASWTFSNTSVGSICNYVGASCWNPQENRLIKVELREFKLSGKIPDSLMYCGSLQILDLAGNDLSGNIPSKICTWLPFLVTLDLSNNRFKGSIPPDLAKCSYLNKLVLSNNKLSGSIPYEFSSLGRLQEFSVATNRLTGRIPSYLDKFGKASFAGNKGLCGGPLEKCKKNLGL